MRAGTIINNNSYQKQGTEKCSMSCALRGSGTKATSIIHPIVYTYTHPRSTLHIALVRRNAGYFIIAPGALALYLLFYASVV